MHSLTNSRFQSFSKSNLPSIMKFYAFFKGYNASISLFKRSKAIPLLQYAKTFFGSNFNASLKKVNASFGLFFTCKR